MNKSFFLVIGLIFLVLVLSGCVQETRTNRPDFDSDTNISGNSVDNQVDDTQDQVEVEFTEMPTFKKTDKEVCLVEGKIPIILYSTTKCPHCVWVGPAFDEVAQEYADSDKLVFRHWQLDLKDDTLTEEAEGELPANVLSDYLSFNPDGTVPTFVFGCKYLRVGTGYENYQGGFQTQEGFEKEKEEFRQVIEELLAKTFS